MPYDFMFYAQTIVDCFYVLFEAKFKVLFYNLTNAKREHELSLYLYLYLYPRLEF